MRLYRSELALGFKEKFFEIPVASLEAEDLPLLGEQIPCSLSVHSIPRGYKLTGVVTLSYQEVCDRCLEPYTSVQEIPFTLLLVDKQEFLEGENPEMIWFPESEQMVDIGPYFHDLVYLEEPLKRLCDEECKGLCSSCGTNLNVATCKCAVRVTETDPQWDSLKMTLSQGA